MPKLLIVEDDQAVRTTMVTVLELEGYAVDAVASTREALACLETQAYPIVISDIYLDERTGIDVLRTARIQNPRPARASSPAGGRRAPCPPIRGAHPEIVGRLAHAGSAASRRPGTTPYQML